jgi:hypothetical protein
LRGFSRKDASASGAGTTTIRSRRGRNLPIRPRSSGQCATRCDRSTTSRAVRWESALFDDLSRSRLEIQRQIGRTPEFLAWPYGFGNPALDRIAIEAGYARTCALRARPNLPLAYGARLVISDTERFEMPRYTVTARTSLREFRQMLEGIYRPET